MRKVFIVLHEYEWCEYEKTKLIGVFDTIKEAEEAVELLSIQPGFCFFPEKFVIIDQIVGSLFWAEGFSISVNILVPYRDDESRFEVATTSWHPGDKYKVESYDPGVEAPDMRFGLGEFVLCEEREVEGERLLLATTRWIAGD